MTLAASANDVQQFSEGRLLLGLGSQIKPHITRRFSMPWSRPAARMREFVLALHAIWDAWNHETKLDFRGEFYSHTLMTPFFAPDPNPFGAPKVMLAGIGERMSEVVGEVADGFLGHSLTTARYLDEVILPAVARGRAKSGRSADGFEASGQLIVITGRDDAEMAAVAETARSSIAFYLSTPAYRGMLEVFDWGSRQDELTRLSKLGEWDAMTKLVDDEMLDTFTIWAEPDAVAAKVVARFGGRYDRVSFTPDMGVPPELFDEIARQLVSDVVAGGNRRCRQRSSRLCCSPTSSGPTALSTSLSADAAEELRQTHFALLRGAIQATGGVEVKNLGDGLMVSFTSPSRAIACAVGIQQGVDNHNRRAAQPLSIRVGVSAGEVTEDDGDYFGDPVVEAARLCAAADGGRILATEVVRAMVGRHATQTFVEVGPLDLKGLPHPVDAVEVVWEPEVVPGTVPLPSRLLAASNDAVFGFVGRAEELTEIDDALKAATTERQARTVLIAGEAGIGKTALVAQVARGAHARGVTVLLGRCTEELLVPYQPWIEVMGHLLEHRPELLESVSPAHRAAMTRFLPSLRDGAGPDFDAETERLVLFEALVRVLELSASDGSTLVVLDDMHWSDAASVQALRHVVAASSALPVVLVCTYRDTDLARGDALTALLADFHREPRVSRRRLVGLDDQELTEYVSAAAGHELDENGIGLAHALYRETGGNPFFTGELLRHLYNSDAIYLNDEGRWVLRGELSDLELPESVRDVVGRRVERLGSDAARVLGLAAVIGREFDVDVLSEVAELAEDPLIDLLDAASAAAIVTETDVALRYRFTHALIQHGLYQDLGASRRQRAHLRVAQVLEDGSTVASAAELARHWVAATRPADLDTALKYVEAAGDDALRALAPEDAIRWYRQALDLIERQDSADPVRQARLLVGLGTAQRHLGDPESRATLLAAGSLAQEIGDVDLLVRRRAGVRRGGGGRPRWRTRSDWGSSKPRSRPPARTISRCGRGSSARRSK